jgi:D-sedoheptulose 7-phosphate isomerase
MSENYQSNYIDSINKGLIDSKYFVQNTEQSINLFFDSINNMLLNLKENNNRIFFFGNGASAAFANHMALDFSKNGKISSKSLSDSALITALSNDYSFDEAMVEYLKIENVESNDLVVTISSSGNSPNILNVLNFCKNKNIITLAFSGLERENKSILLSSYSIYVPMKTYGMVECIHQIFLHLILDKFMGVSEWDRKDFQNMNRNNFKF